MDTAENAIGGLQATVEQGVPPKEITIREVQNGFTVSLQGGKPNKYNRFAGGYRHNLLVAKTKEEAIELATDFLKEED